MSGDPDRDIQLGYVAGVYGVRGWIKIHSFTDPRDNIVTHGHWLLRREDSVRRVDVTAGRMQGKSVIAKIDGVDDRDAAAELIGAEILVPRSALPECEPDSYYWTDLEGMLVRDRDGNELGHVARLLETGAHDVMVLDGAGERLIPFVRGEIVESVDLERREMTVSWDASYWDD